MYKLFLIAHYDNVRERFFMRKWVILGIVSVLFFQCIGNHSTEVMIPNEAIRLRVLANSNSKEDQELKKKVSEAVQGNLYTILENTKGIDAAREKIQNQLPTIYTSVENTLRRENSTQSFQIDYGYHYFPEKEYKGVTYEEGEYESLLVTLGKGEGDNWWCVLFPPLCIMEAEETEAEEETEYQFFIQELIEKYL